MKGVQILMMNKKINTGLGNGYLYNIYACTDSNFAPTGWRVANQSDWNALSTFLGGNSISGGHMRESGTLHWSNAYAGADNSSGLTLFGSGYRDNSGVFSSFGIKTYLGVSDDTESGEVASVPDFGTIDFFIPTVGLKVGASIRLLYTGAGTPTSVTDYDGNVYDVVQIGSQYWTKQNWKCTKLNNGTSIPNVTDVATWAGLTTLARCAYDNDLNNV